MIATVVPFLKSILAPPTCWTCDALLLGSDFLCQPCEEAFELLDSQACVRCALPFGSAETSDHHCDDCLRRPPSFQKVHAAFSFEGPLVSLIHQIKFGQKPQLLRWLASFSLPQFQKCLREFQPDCFLPVPLSWRRLWSRGFNQSYLYAHYLRRFSRRETPLLSQVKRKHGAPQALRNREERLKALKDVFYFSNDICVKDKKVLVVDDVLTTGATAETFSKLILEKGAREVEVFVLARVKEKN